MAKHAKGIGSLNWIGNKMMGNGERETRVVFRLKSKSILFVFYWNPNQLNKDKWAALKNIKGTPQKSIQSGWAPSRWSQVPVGPTNYKLSTILLSHSTAVHAEGITMPTVIRVFVITDVWLVLIKDNHPCINHKWIHVLYYWKAYMMCLQPSCTSASSIGTIIIRQVIINTVQLRREDYVLLYPDNEPCIIWMEYTGAFTVLKSLC